MRRSGWRAAAVMGWVAIAASGAGASTAPRPWTPAHGNTAPVIDSLAPVTVRLGREAVVRPHAYDPDGDRITWTIERLPVGATFSSGTGEMRWTPSAGLTGTYAFPLIATDVQGAASRAAAYVRIDTANRPPAITATPSTQTVAQPGIVTIRVTASDPDGDPVTITMVNQPYGVTFFNGLATVASANRPLGLTEIRFEAKDPGGLTAQVVATVTVTAQPANTAPVILAVADTSVAYHSTLSLRLHASDADHDRLTWSFLQAPSTALLASNDSFAVFTHTPAQTEVGLTQTVRVRAIDTKGASDTVEFAVRVMPGANVAPQFSDGDSAYVFHAGVSQYFTLAVRDADDVGKLTVTATGSPLDMTFRKSGVREGITDFLMSWQAPVGGQSFYAMTLIVRDPAGAADTLHVAVRILAGNVPPIIDAVPDQIAYVNRELMVPLIVHDPDGDPIGYLSITPYTGLPVFIDLEALSPALRFTPRASDAGHTYAIPLQVTDRWNYNLITTQTVTISVYAANLPPVLAPQADMRVRAGHTLSFVEAVSDPDGAQRPVLAWRSLPEGAVVSGTQFAWAPLAMQVGTYTITVVATDSAGLQDSADVHIAVDPNLAPSIVSLSDTTAPVESELQRQAVVRDADDAQFTWTLLQAPAGATIGATSGLVRWRPPLATLGVVQTFVLQVRDPAGNTATTAFTLTPVTRVNRAPVLLDIPTVRGRVGTPLSFTVSASDPDGDVVQIEALGLPAGATLAGATVQWIPTVSQDGYHVITFVARDGFGATDTRSMTVSVIGAPKVQLSWDATHRVVDTPAGAATARLFVRLESGVLNYTGATLTLAWTPSLLAEGGPALTKISAYTQTSPGTCTWLGGASYAPYIYGDVPGQFSANVRNALSLTPCDSGTVLAIDFDARACVESTAVFSLCAFTLQEAGNVSYVVPFADLGVPATIGGGGLHARPCLPDAQFPHLAQSYEILAGDTLMLDASITNGAFTEARYSLAAAPENADIDSLTGALVYATRPGAVDTGNHTFTVVATAASGAFVSQTFQVSVVQGNHAPVVLPIPQHSAYEGTLLDLALTSSDVDGDAVTYSVSNPTGQQGLLSQLNGVWHYYWTPDSTTTACLSQEFTLTVTGTDARGARGTSYATIFVLDASTVHLPPSADLLPDIYVAENATYSAQLTVHAGTAGGELRWTALQLPPGGALSPSGQYTQPRYTMTATTAYPSRVVVTDGCGLSDTLAFTVTIVDLPTLPSFAVTGGVPPFELFGKPLQVCTQSPRQVRVRVAGGSPTDRLRVALAPAVSWITASLLPNARNTADSLVVLNYLAPPELQGQTVQFTLTLTTQASDVSATTAFSMLVSCTDAEHDSLQQPDAVLPSMRLAPQPVRATARIFYTLPSAAHVHIAAYAVDGRQVALALDRDEDAGSHALAWDPRGASGLPLPTGVYYVRGTLGAAVFTQRVLILR